MQYIVRYGELFLKSLQVKRQMAHKLAENIKNMMDRDKVRGTVSVKQDSIFVESDNKKAIDVLKKTFGISVFSPVVECEKNIDKIIDESLKLSQKFKGKTFAVRARRADKKFEYTSQRLQEMIGAEICKKGYKVDLSNPENTIYIDIRKKCYVYTTVLRGPGGMPGGSGGKMVLILKDKKSMISGWLMMKRGVTVIPVCNSKSCEKFVKMLDRWSPHPIKFFVSKEVKSIVKKKKALGIISTDIISADIPAYYPVIGLDTKMYEKIISS